MIRTKFQASEPDAYEEEDFEYFVCISMLRNKDTLVRGHLGGRGP